MTDGNNCCRSSVGAIKQVDCLVILSESRDGTLVAGSKSIHARKKTP